MKETNKFFDIKRCYNVLRFDLIMNSKKLLYGSIAIVLYMFFIDLYTLSFGVQEFRIGDYAGLNMFMFSTLLFLLVGTSFPMLRNKRSSVVFLMIPASVFEKILVQFLLRIVAFSVLYIPLFWLVFKGAVLFYGLFEWPHELRIYSFGLFDMFFISRVPWLILLIFCIAFFAFAAFLFAGSVYFKKYAVFKSVIALIGFVGSVSLFSIILSYLFVPSLVHLYGFNVYSRSINQHFSNFGLYVFIILVLSSLFLLPYAYYCLKEKEV